MSADAPLSPDETKALQFLDRQPGEWYCTHCWARAVGVDVRFIHRFSTILPTLTALAAGYEAMADGPCKVCDARRPGGTVLKSARSVRSRGTPVGA